MTDLNQVVMAILDRRQVLPSERSMLVAVSGIDGSGKGYMTSKIVARLREHNLNAVGINIDGWLNLPEKRFDPHNPAEHFYKYAIRFDEMFDQLILPLKEKRSHHVVADFAEETATEYRRHTYDFENVDIIVLEGIFLLKRDFRSHYDLSIWIDCTFQTALERALERGQEGLPPAETVLAFEIIYFPAQRIHFDRDDPQSAARLIISNDPRMTRDA